jgi:hypothetical protein
MLGDDDCSRKFDQQTSRTFFIEEMLRRYGCSRIFDAKILYSQSSLRKKDGKISQRKMKLIRRG